MKKIKIFLILGLLCSFTGCKQDAKEDLDAGYVSIDKLEEYLEENKEELEESRKEIEISKEKVRIEYIGEEFLKSVFAVGSDQIYVCGLKEEGNYFLGNMEIEKNKLEEIEVDAGENMRIFRMVVDTTGRCHVLWRSVAQIEEGNQILDFVTFEKSFIMVVNQEGVVEKEIEVSEIFEEMSLMPYSFQIDFSGNYYVENQKEVIQLLPDGSLGKVIPCERRIEGIGIGKSGEVYASYRLENGESWLGKIEKDGCKAMVKLPDSQVIYKGIYEGVDSELLLYHLLNGTYAYDATTQEIEERIVYPELSPKGEQVSGYGVLADGRLCLLEQTEGKSIFYYIPLGR